MSEVLIYNVENNQKFKKKKLKWEGVSKLLAGAIYVSAVVYCIFKFVYTVVTVMQLLTCNPGRDFVFFYLLIYFIPFFMCCIS